MPTYDDLQSKLSGLHFAQESLTKGEREILHLAEAMLRQRDADLLAATQEVERLRKLVGEAVGYASRLAARDPDDDTCVQCGRWLGISGHQCGLLRERLAAIRRAAGVEGKGE